MRAARLPGLTGGWAGRGGFTACSLCLLSPLPGTQPTGGAPHRHLAARVPGPATGRAALCGWGLVPGRLAQAAGRVIVGPQGGGHLVLSCPRRAGTQAGLGRPGRQRQAEQ